MNSELSGTFSPLQTHGSPVKEHPLAIMNALNKTIFFIENDVYIETVVQYLIYRSNDLTTVMESKITLLRIYVGVSPNSMF